MIENVGPNECVEVYEVLKNNKFFIEKIPEKIIKKIRDKAKYSRYLFKYNGEESINQLNRNSLALIVYLYLKYVAKDSNEKEMIKQILIKNQVEVKKGSE